VFQPDHTAKKDPFGELCGKATPNGMRLAFESMSISVIHTLADALSQVQGAAASNGGLAIDIWRMKNLRMPLTEVPRIPKEFLVCVELNDTKRNRGSEKPVADDRCCCGDGHFDVRRFVEITRKTGYRGPMGVEQFAQGLPGTPVGEVARTDAEFLDRQPNQPAESL